MFLPNRFVDIYMCMYTKLKFMFGFFLENFNFLSKLKIDIMKYFNFLMKLQLKMNFLWRLNFFLKLDNFLENFNFLNHCL